MGDDQMTDGEKLLSRCRILSERVAQHNRRIKAEEQALGSETTVFYKELKEKYKVALQSALDISDKEQKLEVFRATRKLFEGQGPGGDLRLIDPASNKTPFLLKALLGKDATGVLVRPDQRLKLKQEYYKFRQQMATLFTIVPVLLALGLKRVSKLQAAGEKLTMSPPLWVSLQAYAVWLVYFYASLALRENVLVMNGSDIRPWWIQHHYVMIVFVIVLVTLPTESTAFKVFAEKFIVFNVFQGLLMMFQNRYQTRRLYRQIALGRNNAMDVVSAETSPGKGQLLFLYPALFVMQGFQAYMSVDAILFSFKDMFKISGWLDEIPTSADLRGARGVFICGLLFMVLAIGNMTSTFATIVAKVRKNQKRLKNKTK